MNFLHSLTHSFEDDLVEPPSNQGRPSNMHNEDDYDYAIELKSEEEYREIAAKSSQFMDFAEIDFNKIAQEYYDDQNEKKDDSNDDDHVSVSTFDSGTNHDNPSKTKEDNETIDQKSYLKKMYRLSQRKLWVETVSRRSSLLYQKERFLSNEEIQRKFLEILLNGCQVRRHQANKFAEKVTLFGEWIDESQNQSQQTIENLTSLRWEPEESSRIRKYLRTRRADADTEVLDEEGEISEWTLDNCARVCGCGDNLFGGVKENQYTGRTSVSRANIHMDRDYQESILTNQLYNYGFERKGVINLTDILAVQPALQSDPTQQGEKATKNLRESLDLHNPHLSFSIVTKSFFSYGGVKSLDVECDDEETYLVLLSGFVLLSRSTIETNYLKKDELKKQKSEVLKRVASELESVIVKSPQRMMSNAKSSFFATTGLKMVHEDPIERMFFPDLERGEGEKNSQFADFMQQNSLAPPAQFLGWTTKGTQIWARLRMAGLEVKPIFSWDLKRVILKIRCPTWRLEEVAEKMHIRLRLKIGGYKRFKITQRDLFSTTSDGLIFRSSERQRVIDFILRSKIKDGGAELDENTPLGEAIVQRFPLHMITRLEDLKNSWVFFWRAEQPGDIPKPWSPFSTPIRVTTNRLYQSITYWWDGLLDQPLDQIAEYYGESIAFYFAWVAFFTRWLFLPSILGLIVFAVQISSHNMDHWICIPYGVFIVIWCSLMLVFWRQKQSALAYRWGVLGFEMEETERPQFKGNTVYDPSTQEMRRVYPPQRRLGKYLIAAPVMLCLTGVMLLVMTVVLFSQERISRDYNEGKDLGYMPSFEILYQDPSSFYQGNSTTTETPSMALGKLFSFNSGYWMAMMYFPSMYGLIVSLVSEFVDYAALKLTDFENHRKESTYGSRLILKIFCFRFVAVFTPVYYYAFFVDNHEEAYVKMFMCILALVTVGDWWKKFLSTCLPAWIHRFQMYRLKLSLSSTNRLIWEAKWATEFKSSDEKNAEEQNKLIQRREHYHRDALSSIWGEALKQDFTGIEDYTLVILQLGFVLLFGIVFPLGPFIALFNNLFFLRIDAAKLMFTRKRPIAKKIGGLGVWEDVLQIMSVIGILTNCCLMLFTSTRLKQLFSFLGVGGVAVFLFAYEHVMLFLKYFLHSSINRIPASVQRDQERNRLLSQKRKYERNGNSRNKRNGDENSQEIFGETRANTNGPSQLPSVQSFSSYPHTSHESAREKSDILRRRSGRSESATLAADPFEFQSENGDDFPPPVNCLSEINFNNFDQSKRSLSPLFEILRLKDPESQLPHKINDNDSDCSSSSSSDSDSYSHKSQGRYALPRPFNRSSGPGPATFGSMNQLYGAGAGAGGVGSAGVGNSSQLKSNVESRRESLQSESVVSFDENDEECWRIESLAHIDTLASARKPLGPDRIQCIEPPHERTLRRCSTFESNISSLTGPSAWTFQDEPSHPPTPPMSPSRRASLLQAPLDIAPPKAIREFRKPSLGVQSTSPSLRRGVRASPPSNSSKTTPESLKMWQSPSNQQQESSTTTDSQFTQSPAVYQSPLEKQFTPPSAPLPQKPVSRLVLLHAEPSIPSLPPRAEAGNTRRSPGRKEIYLDEPVLSSPIYRMKESCEGTEDSANPEIIQINDQFEDSEDFENHAILGNSPEGKIPEEPMEKNLKTSQSEHSAKNTPEPQLERPKLRPKKKEVSKSKQVGEKNESGPKSSSTTTILKTPIKSRNTATVTTPTTTPNRMVVENKPTFQQRMESWLRHSDHSPEAPNPFLEVLKDK